MYISKEASELFAKARQENREIFQKHWNQFLVSKPLLVALIIFSALQGLFFVFSGGFIHRQVDLIGLLRDPTPMWQKLMILGIQILLNLPGTLCCLGMWIIWKKTRWENDAVPHLTGVRILRWTNWCVSIVTGLLLGLYPTVIIYAGDYLTQTELTRVFYLFLTSTLLFAVSVTLMRLVLRFLEDNITCCWAKTGWVLPLCFAFGGAILALLLFMKKIDLFLIVTILLFGCVIGILLIYRSFLSRVSILQEEVDQKVIQTREKSYDPYSRY